MSRLRAVLLDAGGTLIHPDRDFILDRLRADGIDVDAGAWAGAHRAALAALGDILRSDDPGTDRSRSIAYFAMLLGRLGLPAHRLPAVGADLRARHEAGRLWIRVEPGTLDVLHGLRDAGLGLAVISNADGRVAEYLANAGLADLFAFILDSTLVGVEKPDPRIFAMACERLGVQPAEAVYVGDSYEVDVLGARAAGMRGILLADETRDGVDCIASLQQLTTLLGLGAPGDRAGADRVPR